MNISPDKKLFHYTSLETFMKYILPTKLLKLSKIKDSRDPYEYHAFKVFLMEDDMQNDKSFNEFLEAVKNLKLNSQYLCLCMPDCKTIDFESYTRWGYERPKLWESYGDNHRGICIALQRDKLLVEFRNNKMNLQSGKLAHKEILYKDIVYSSSILKSNSLIDYHYAHKRFNQSQFLKNFKDALFFQKDYDYQDENEYRLVYITNKQQEDIKLDISDAVTELYFGDKVDIGFIEFYKDLFIQAFPNTELFQVQWFNGTAQRRYIRPD